MAEALLQVSLQAAVPLYMMELRHLPESERIEQARASAQFVAEHGDDILFRATRKGATAEAFNHLARGVALAAFQPGGVTVFGQHWCADHARCQQPEDSPTAQRQRRVDVAYLPGDAPC